MTELELRALTFNVFHDYPRCRHIERRLKIVEEALAAEAPDFVILQEVSSSHLYGDVSRRLVGALRSRGLSYELHYAPANGSLARGEAFEEGGAILSRWPLRDAAVRRLAEEVAVEREYHGYRYTEYRIAVAATAVVAGAFEVEVVGAHLTDTEPAAGFHPRRHQVEDLVRFAGARAAGKPLVLVGGDFNAPPDAGEIECLRREGFVDLCGGRDPGPTNDPRDRNLEDPRETASQRIDHLFARTASHALEVRDARLFLDRPVEVEPGRHLWASDHNGVLAVVRVRA